MQSLLQKDKNLDEETSRHWGEIRDRSYVFDRRARDAQAVGQLSQVCGLTLSSLGRVDVAMEQTKMSMLFQGNRLRCLVVDFLTTAQ